MGLFVEFDVIDDFGFIEATEEFGIRPDYQQGCDVFAETFLRVSKSLVPVDTGYLRSTLRAEGSDTYCMAETDCEYAQYPEFGTYCQAEQPYFTPALEEALAEAEPYWSDAQEWALLEEQELLEARAEQQKQETMSRMAMAEGKGPQAVGGINFSSFGSFIGSVLGSFLAALIVTTVQAMLGKDFTEGGKGGRGFGGGGQVYVPEVIIT